MHGEDIVDRQVVAPPQQQRQQRQPAAAAPAPAPAVTSGERRRVGTNAGGVGGGAARRERVPAAAGVATDWNAPSSDGTSPAVTVLGGGARSDAFVDDDPSPMMERMALEAEEQMEQMDEDDAFEGDGMMGGW